MGLCIVYGLFLVMWVYHRSRVYDYCGRLVDEVSEGWHELYCLGEEGKESGKTYRYWEGVYEEEGYVEIDRETILGRVGARFLAAKKIWKREMLSFWVMSVVCGLFMVGSGVFLFDLAGRDGVVLGLGIVVGWLLVVIVMGGAFFVGSVLMWLQDRTAAGALVKRGKEFLEDGRFVYMEAPFVPVDEHTRELKKLHTYTIRPEMIKKLGDLSREWKKLKKFWYGV